MKLLVVGDVMLGRLVNDVLKEEPPDDPWGNTLNLFKSADFRLINLECAISDKGSPWTKTPKVFHFRTDAKNIDVLKEANIDAVSLANNHILDYDYEAMEDTLKILDANNIAYAGAGHNIKAAMAPAIINIQGLKIGLISLTDNEHDWEATSDSPGTYYMPIALEDKRFPKLIDLIKKTKDKVDILITALHWGPNWGYVPNPHHVPFAHSLIDNGVDIIFGHSCHVFQGIEIYKNRPILYSTGDFIDDYAVDRVDRNDQSFIFMIETHEQTIKSLKLYPTLITDFQSTLAEGFTAERITDQMKSLCSDFNTQAIWNKALKCLEIKVD